MILGITGGSGCGKTTLLNQVQALGGLVLDCDEIYHRLLREDEALLRAIGARFPGTVSEGTLQRKKLGQQVFSDPQALEDLNESMSASQDLTALQMEKQRLEFELQKTKEDLAQAEESLEKLEKQAQALEWLRQMEAASRTSYTSLKTLVEQFEESELVDYLPTESVVEGADAPADVYRNLYAMIY